MPDLSFFSMIKEIIANPMLLVTMILTLGVTFVNGWTDAPNAIATSISTRSIGVRPAILMAAICNLFSADYSGLCGDNLYWQYYPNDSILEIKGYGNMKQYTVYLKKDDNSPLIHVSVDEIRRELSEQTVSVQP